MCSQLPNHDCVDYALQGGFIFIYIFFGLIAWLCWVLLNVHFRQEFWR